VGVKKKGVRERDIIKKIGKVRGMNSKFAVKRLYRGERVRKTTQRSVLEGGCQFKYVEYGRMGLKVFLSEGGVQVSKMKEDC